MPTFSIPPLLPNPKVSWLKTEIYSGKKPKYAAKATGAKVPALALSPLSTLSATGAWEQKPSHHLLLFAAASLQWPWLGQPPVSVTLVRLVSRYSKQQGGQLSCSPLSRELCQPRPG